MAKSYNWLGAQKVNDLSIGLCPVCNRRLSAECEHRTIESEEWYALHLVADQEAHNEKATDPYRRPVDRDDADILAAARTVSPDAVLTSGKAQELGTRFTISGGEVMELDSHLESQYNEQNGDIDLPL